jgi:hypothetical protein
LILGGALVVAGVVAFALSFTMPDVAEPAYPHFQYEYTNGYAVSHLPMAAIALILAGVLIGVLPAGRSPYRLILSGIAVATAPLGVVTTVRAVETAVAVPAPPLNRIAFVAALAVGLAPAVGRGPLLPSSASRPACIPPIPGAASVAACSWRQRTAARSLGGVLQLPARRSMPFEMMRSR